MGKPVTSVCSAFGFFSLFACTLIVGCNRQPVTCKDLILSSFDGDMTKIKSLLDASIDVNCKSDVTVSSADGSFKVKSDTTALLAASLAGRPETVKTLLARGARPDVVAKFGITPVIVAAYVGNVDSIRALLKEGARLDRADEGGSTPLHYAILGSHPEIAALLIEAGAKPDPVNGTGWTPLAMACIGSPLKEKMNMMASRESGKLPLSTSDSEWRPTDTKCIEVLLSHGASPTIKDSFGMTPLQSAVFFAPDDVCILLAKKVAVSNTTELDAAIRVASGGQRSALARTMSKMKR